MRAFLPVRWCCLTLRPRDWGPPSSSVQGMFQAGTLEQAAISLRRGSSPPRDPTCVSCVGRQVLYQLSHQGSPKEIK